MISKSFRSYLYILILALGVAACSSGSPGSKTDASPADSDIPQTDTSSSGVAPGIWGRYSALTSLSNTLYLSAYEESYGDLILVSIDSSDLSKRQFKVVDGVPDEEPKFDPSGYRGGIIGKGDDVGRGSDIAMNSNGQIIMSYGNMTTGSLKYAEYDGSQFQIHDVDSPAVNSQEVFARHTSLTLGKSNPVIFYTVENIYDENTQSFSSELRVAKGNTPSPALASDWTIEVLTSAPMECRGLCQAGEACFIETNGSSRCKQTTNDCTSCVEGTACLSGKCADILADLPYEDIPKRAALWPQSTSDESTLWVTYYDSLNGRLGVARQLIGDTSWTIEKYSDTTGRSIGAYPTLLLDGNTLHVVAQDVDAGSLLHYQLDPTTLKTSKSLIQVDSGIRTDGLHTVGADAKLIKDNVGIRLFYQDQHTANLLMATFSDDKWSPSDSSEANWGRLFAGGEKGYGFYTDLTLVNNTVYGSHLVFEAGQTSGVAIEFFSITN